VSHVKYTTAPLSLRPHQRTDRATAIGNMHKKMVKIMHVVREICLQTEGQTHTHTDRQTDRQADRRRNVRPLPTRCPATSMLATDTGSELLALHVLVNADQLNNVRLKDLQ